MTPKIYPTSTMISCPLLRIRLLQQESSQHLRIQLGRMQRWCSRAWRVVDDVGGADCHRFPLPLLDELPQRLSKAHTISVARARILEVFIYASCDIVVADEVHVGMYSKKCANNVGPAYKSITWNLTYLIIYLQKHQFC